MCLSKQIKNLLKARDRVFGDKNNMENQELIKYIEEIKKLMIKVSTWLANIMNVDDEYKNLYILLSREFKKRWIKNNNEYLSLWDFYNFWKENWLATYESRRKHVRDLYKHIEYDILINHQGHESLTDTTTSVVEYLYFSNERIDELKQVKCDFDLSKLIKILEETNISYKSGWYLWTSSLLRMLLDHIPPIFWKNTFNEIANNYPFSRSDKNNILHLLGWLRNIADWNLHGQITTKEILPTKQSLEFRADFDVLLKGSRQGDLYFS
jgi:hypothetical protein